MQSMNRRILIVVCIAWVYSFLTALPSFAHFGMIIPSDQMVMQGEPTDIRIVLMFRHPFEGTGMNLAKPANFSVVANGKQQNLLNTLNPLDMNGHQAWSTQYAIKRPGIYVFYMEPQPYWEPAEDCFIIHYTKTVVAAFGDDEGWDKEIGLPTEIVPMAKPFGLYAGNVFQGIVKVNGKTVPHAEVEIEVYNSEGKVTAPTDYMVTQTIKADPNGIFTYGVPKPGWWGFAALNTSDKKIKHDGEEKDVEIGAVLWIEFFEMK